MDHVLCRALERNLPLDALRHELELVLDVLLEIAIGRAARHRAHRAHSAIGFEGAALVDEGLARRFLGAGEQRADHDGGGTGRERLGDVARCAQAAIANNRHTLLLRFLGRVHDRGELRHADASDDARGTDRARPDADLEAIRARTDQRLGCFRGGNIAGDHLHRIRQALHPVDRLGDVAVVAVRGVDYDQVAFRIDQRLGALEALIAHSRRRRDAQATGRVLRGGRVIHRLLHVLHGDEANATIGVVDHQQLFDSACMEQPTRLILPGAQRHGREVLAGHQLGYELARVLGETDVAIGEDADQLARRFGDRNTRDAVARHQRLRVGQRRVGRDSDGVHHHAAFVTLHRADGGRLLLNGQIAMEHPQPPKLRHHDRHVGLSHSIHRGRQDRDIEADLLGYLRPRVCHAGEHLRFGGLEEHVVKGKAEADFHG